MNPEFVNGSTVVLDGNELPPVEPECICETCGIRGTVGRAIRTDQHGELTEIHRFCASCWVEESARLRARWSEQDRLAGDAWLRGVLGALRPHGGSSFVSATWHGVLERIMHLRELRGHGANIPDDVLRKLAIDIESRRADFVGEMPLEVETFIQIQREL
jgi:hypothetical protein